MKKIYIVFCLLNSFLVAEDIVICQDEQNKYEFVLSKDEASNNFNFKKYETCSVYGKRQVAEITELLCDFKEGDNMIFSCRGAANPYRSFLYSHRVCEEDMSENERNYVKIKYFTGYKFGNKDGEYYGIEDCIVKQ